MYVRCLKHYVLHFRQPGKRPQNFGQRPFYSLSCGVFLSKEDAEAYAELEGRHLKVMETLRERDARIAELEDQLERERVEQRRIAALLTTEVEAEKGLSRRVELELEAKVRVRVQVSTREKARARSREAYAL